MKKSVLRHIWPALLLLLAGVISYWNSFDSPFVFDDFATIESNSSVQFGDQLTHVPLNLWSRTLLYVTFAANFAAGGQNVWGYHLVNLLLHLLNGLLIYFLALRIWAISRFSGGGPLARSPIPEQATTFALLAALFFIIHPVQTESVTYVSSRSELLSTLFYIVAVLLFIRKAPEKIGFSFCLLTAAILVLALGAKETTISLPAALLLYDFIFLSNGDIRKVVRRWPFHTPFLAGGLAAAFYLAWFGSLRCSVGTGASGISPYSYFLTELRVVVRYVQITLIPSGLNLAYDFPLSNSFWEPRVILSSLALLGVVSWAWWLRKRQPIVSFSILWFFITLAPTSSFFPIRDVIFEHRLYLPMVGLCLSFPILIEFLFAASRRRYAPRSASPAGRLNRSAAGLVSSAILVVLMAATVMRNEVWRDEVRLWSDVVAKSPDGPRGYAALTWAYTRRGDYEKALEVTKVGVTKARDNANSLENHVKFYSNLGQLYFILGRYPESVDAWSQSLKWNMPPAERARNYYNMAVAYIAVLNRLSGNAKEKVASLAEEALMKSIESDGNFLPAWDSYANLSVDRGTQKIARQRFNQELQKNPAKAFYGLGKIAFQERNYKEAVDYFAQADKFLHEERLFLFNYAYASLEAGNVDRAIDKYIAVTRLDPLFSQAHYNLALIYIKKHLDQPAIEHLEQVLRIDTKSTSAHLQDRKSTR